MNEPVGVFDADAVLHFVDDDAAFQAGVASTSSAATALDNHAQRLLDGVVELEGDRQRGLEESPPVFAPSQEGIGEHLGVDAHHRVDFAFWQRRGVDGHVLFAQEVVLVGVVDLTCQPEVVFVELVDIIREGYVAEMGLTL